MNANLFFYIRKVAAQIPLIGAPSTSLMRPSVYANPSFIDAYSAGQNKCSVLMLLAFALAAVLRTFAIYLPISFIVLTVIAALLTFYPLTSLKPSTRSGMITFFFLSLVLASLYFQSRSLLVFFLDTDALSVTPLLLVILLSMFGGECCRGAYCPPFSLMSFLTRAFPLLFLTSYLLLMQMMSVLFMLARPPPVNPLICLSSIIMLFFSSAQP
jgi:hypothetical protein